MSDAVRCQVSARTHRGGRREGPNQDAFAVARGATWLGAFVADGMGGRPGGRVAARVGARAAAQACAKFAPRPTAELARLAADAAREAVLTERSHRPEVAQMASTLVGAVTDGRTVAVAWLGDSRCYRVRRGTVDQLTTDHARWRDGRIVINRYLGSATTPPEVATTRVRSGDRFVLCSDGLFGGLSSPQAEIAACSGYGSATAIARALVSRALRRGANDNVTVVVLSFVGTARENAAVALLRDLTSAARRWRIAARAFDGLSRFRDHASKRVASATAAQEHE